MVAILTMLEKFTTPGLLKIKLFLKNGYNVIISIHGAANKVLPRDSNYFVDVVMDVVMRSELANSGISTREVILTSTL